MANPANLPHLLSEANAMITSLFNQVDIDRNGRISMDEAGRMLLKFNSKLGRSYGENEVQTFFRSLDKNNDGYIDLEEFKAAFLKTFR